MAKLMANLAQLSAFQFSDEAIRDLPREILGLLECYK
jgi:hypothetical protein